MISLLRFGVVISIAFVLGTVMTLWLVPPEVALARVAPERYLAGVHTYYGTANISDESKDSTQVPLSIVAWRRLVGARDIRAFVRLASTATPAGRLYGIAGLRALAPATPLPEFIAVRSDSVFLNSNCGQRYQPFAFALRELDVPGWPDSLQQAPVECR